MFKGHPEKVLLLLRFRLILSAVSQLADRKTIFGCWSNYSVVSETS